MLISNLDITFTSISCSTSIQFLKTALNKDTSKPEYEAVYPEACFYDTNSSYSSPQHVCGGRREPRRTYPHHVIKITVKIQEE